MRSSENKRVQTLAGAAGAAFKQGKGSHLKVYLNGRMSVLPMRGAKELGTGLMEKIKKDLGLK
jgi:mRNA interferase HicA